MITILRGSIRAHAASNAWRIHAIPIDFKARQIIVGVSISDDSQATYHHDMPVIPAILDIGFNRSFSIHQFFLEQSAGIAKSSLARVGTLLQPSATRIIDLAAQRTYQGHAYDNHFASLWLHRAPYAFNDMRRVKREPIRLTRTTDIMVYKYQHGTNYKNIDRNDIYPRMPLLGLRSLTENQLRLFVEGERNRYSISRSFRSWLYSDEPR